MGSWSLRPDGIFDYWSPETFAIFGFDPAKGIPTLKEWLDVLHPTDGDRVHALIRKMFSEGMKGDIQYRVEHPEHGQKMMHSTGEPMFEDGEVARLIGNTLDITEQEKLTQELRRREAYLAEAQRLCPPFSEMQSSRIVPLASAPASCAVPYSTTRDHCGALRTLSLNISNSALNIAPALARASPLGDCACPFPPHRLRVCLRRVVIICAILAVLSALPIPRSPPRKAGRPAAGVQIITN
jgi:PAS domain S-box-containing protein